MKTLTDCSGCMSRPSLGGLGRYCVGVILAVTPFLSGCLNESPVNSAAAATQETPLYEVRVQPISRAQYTNTVSSYAEIQAHQNSHLNPLVSARVEWISEKFEVGQFVSQDEPLVRLDTTDFEFALAQAQQQVQQAQVELAEQRALQKRAQADWRTVNKSGQPTGLAARGPYVKATQAKLDAAEKNVAKAERDLAATEIKSPYGGWITQRNVSLGDRISPQDAVAQLISADRIIVRIPVTVAQLSTIEQAGGLSETRVLLQRSERAGEQWQLQGLSVRPVTETETRNLMLQAIMVRQADKKTALPFPGEVLQAQIQTQESGEYFAIPESAVNEQGEVFLFDQGVARAVAIDAFFRTQGKVIASVGQFEDINLIVNNTQRIWDGMPVKSRVMDP